MPKISKTLRRSDIEEVAAGLRRLLDAVESGDLTAPAGLVGQLEGTVVGLEMLARAKFRSRL